MEQCPLQVIVSALQLSLMADNNTLIQQATAILTEESAKDKYIIWLLAIINEKEISKEMTLAALTQLKNVLRSRWVDRQFGISRKKYVPFSNEDKQFLIDSILQTNISLSDNHKFAKIIKDILVIIGKETLSLASTVIQLMRNGSELRTCLNFMLGLANCFNLEDGSNEKTKYFQMLEVVVPILTKLVQSGEQNIKQRYEFLIENQTSTNLEIYNKQKSFFEQILYMSIKFIYKTINYDFPPSLRRYCCDWAIFALCELTKVDAKCSEIASKDPLFCGLRGTDMFTYFHSKKWAARYLSKFLERIMVYKRSDPQITQITKDFYRDNENLLSTSIKVALQRPQPNKVRHQEIMFLQKLFDFKPKLMKSEMDFYQFKVLPFYMLTSKKERQLAIDNPIEFLMGQSLYRNNQFDTVKKLVTNFWKKLAKSDSDEQFTPKHVKIEGEQIVKSLLNIKLWMYHDSQEIKQLALYLLIQVAQAISNFEKSLEIAKEVLNQVIPSILDMEDLLLRVRGFQLIYSYSRFLPQYTVNEIFEQIIKVFQIFSQKNNFPNIQGIDVLAITAGMALEKIICINPSIRRLTSQEIQMLLRSVLDLTQKYEVEDLAFLLTSLVDKYPREMEAYSIQLVQEMSKVIKQSMKKESENIYSYASSKIGAGLVEAIVSLSFLTLTSKNNQLRDVLDEEISTILEDQFSYENGQGFDMYENLLSMLNSYINYQTNNLEGLSNKIMFYFPVFLFKFSPLNQHSLRLVNNLNINENQKKIFQKCKYVDDYSPQLLFEIIKNFLKFIRPEQVPLQSLQQTAKDIFSSSLLDQFFYCILRNYRVKKENETLEDYYLQFGKGRYISTKLLISFLEHYGDKLHKSVYAMIFKVIQLNHKAKHLSKFLIDINFQLFCLWVWATKEQSLSTENDINGLEKFLQRVFTTEGINETLRVIKTNPQRKRVILGFTTLILLCINCNKILVYLQIITSWLMFFVVQNAKMFDIYQDDDHEENENEDEEELPKFKQPLTVRTQSKVPIQHNQNQRQIQQQEYVNTLIDFREDHTRYKEPTFQQKIHAQMQQIQFNEEDEDEEYVPLQQIDEIQIFIDSLVTLQHSSPHLFSFMQQTYFYQIQSLLQTLGIIEDEPYSSLVSSRNIQQKQ